MAKLFVGSLPPGATQADLVQVFSAYGQVNEVVLMKPGAVTRQRGAFVRMDTLESAQTAITALNGVYKLRDQDTDFICVRFAQESKSRPARALPPSSLPNIAALAQPPLGPVANLSLPHGLASQYDPATCAKILALADPEALAAMGVSAARVRDLHSQGQTPLHLATPVAVPTYGQGAFTTFPDMGSLANTGFTLDPGSLVPLEGCQPQLAAPRTSRQLHEQPQPTPKLFVGGLPPLITQELLASVFAPYGKVEEVLIIKSKSSSGAGCAFVKYFSVESATEAMKALDGLYQMHSQMAPIAVRYATSSGKKKIR